jgi:hypothetical protein
MPYNNVGLRKFQANPLIFLAFDFSRPVGKATNIRWLKGSLIFEAELTEEATRLIHGNPEFDVAFQVTKSHSIKGARFVDDCELLTVGLMVKPVTQLS